MVHLYLPRTVTTIDFQNIRAEPKSKRDSFEALSILLFQVTTTVPPDCEFVSIRGDGGDGGVEAYFRTPTGGIIGLQAKYFFKLGDSEFSQIKDSYKTALENYPTLTDYYTYIPFDLTGRRSAGMRGKSETERFDEWRTKMKALAEASGQPVAIHLVQEARVREKLLSIDRHGGHRRYWFSGSVLEKAQIVCGLEHAKAFAGPRHSSLVDVATDAHEALDFFGRILSPDDWVEQHIRPYRYAFGSIAEVSERLFSVLDTGARAEAAEAARAIRHAFTLMRAPDFVENHADTLERDLERLLPYVEDTERGHYKQFCDTHGEENDNPRFRQFQAEMMMAFPAADLDRCREVSRAVPELLQRLRSPAVKASRAKSLLLVGPPGIGKTHELVAAAFRRVDAGGLSLVVFGEDFADGQPWEVVRTKLGFGASVGRDELFECLSASAASTGIPFVIYIDALNETPDAARWRDRLPEFLSQVAGFPNILVCVSTRDTYRDLVVDERFPGFAFNHKGFEGRQMEALEAFCAAYHIGSEITPLFSEELANPLLLHLACKTIKADGGANIDLSAPGFTELFERYLDVCDIAIRRRRSLSNPTNLVRRCLRELANTWADGAAGSINYEIAAARLAAIVGGDIQASAMLDELQREGLLIISETTKDEWVVRFAYQKFGDSLFAANLMESCSSGGVVDLTKLGHALAEFPAEQAGIIEAVASALPERMNVEITDDRLKLDPTVSSPALIRSVTFRSRKSITADTAEAFEQSLYVPGLWQSVYEAALKMAMVPDCGLNADWLHRFLSQQPLVVRDRYLSRVLYGSFEDRGVVRSIIDAALRADIARWPTESRRLLAVSLMWMTSCADRRVRDQSTKALTRVFSLYPSLGGELVELFEGADDDYILESLTLGVYCGSLLTRGRQREFIAVLDQLATPSFSIANVMVRDSIRMLGQSLAESVGIPVELRLRVEDFCRPQPMPTTWPTYADAELFTSIEGLPPNMDLSSKWGTDFKRYVLQSKTCCFDLASEGITDENVASWIMLEVLRLGYPGPKQVGLNYDYEIHNKHGSGRSRPGYAERLGKKYYWIALHRLVGILARNVSPKSWNGDLVAFTPEYFWSVDLRKVDVTDIRDISPARNYDAYVVGNARFPFPDVNQVDDLSWVKSDDLTRHEGCLFRTSIEGVDWFALSFYARDGEREDDEYSHDYRYLTVDYSSFLMDAAKEITADFLEETHAFSSQGNHCYRAFFAEYPHSAAFRQCVRSESVALNCDDDLFYTDVELLRGSEWEYDYAANGRQPNFSVPAPELVESLGLVWDHQSGWTDSSGELGAFSVETDLRSGLYIRRDLLDRHLRKAGQHLLIGRFHNRGRMDGPSSDAWSYLRYDGNGLTELYQTSTVFEG
ncbi:ATP-binding protein [Burkholderia contaminans]|uniref:AAA ATPase n=1 Tax=Burkholderia contaminans TaxID=488447 RepID=A0A6P3BGB3_9BURK|nr:ATP-binding protein [Burkholderia contaminans]VWD55768.1 AAA ATPase [Burkholderia contaminans]